MERNSRDTEILIEKAKTKMVTLLMTISVAPLIITVLVIGGLGALLSYGGLDTKTVMAIQLGSAICLPILFCVGAWYYSRSLIDSIRRIGKNMDALAGGDLSKLNLKESPVQEVFDLETSLAGLQGNLDRTIGNVKASTTILVEKIADVAELTGSTFERANQIEEVIVNLTEATNSMSENVQSINQQVIEIGNCVNDIYGKVDILHGNSENMLEVNSKTNDDMAVIKENSDRSLDAVNNITDQIKEANDAIREIDTAVELILNISDQTNLLSLNASIEAARAGESGKGFAVVAEEIRSLSEQSAEGAEMIRRLAQKITKESAKTVTLAKQVLELIQEGSDKVGMAQEQYEELSQKIQHSAEEIRALMAKADQLNDYKARIVENVHDLSAISEQNAASHEEVNANVNEIVSEVRVVKNDCEDMNEKAQELGKVVEFFHK
ncbi:MAG: hypothetical protein IKO03_15715 [Lachnospiraceae bacterium]|nr:hypothetical protein [Lachnospiraceae bacterium]MBR3510205.1 hypothetical protein [Lachnospiraceae bacterium]